MAKTKKKTRKSRAKKAKVYIPAYKIIISCAAIITICMGLLLYTTLTAPKTEVINQQFTEKLTNDDKKADDKTSQTTKESLAKESSSKKDSSTKKEPEKKEAAAESAKKTTEKTVPAPAKPATESKPTAKKPAEKQETPAATKPTATKPAQDTKPAPPKKPAASKSDAPATSTKPATSTSAAPAPTPVPAPAKAASKFNFPPAKNGATIVIVIDDAGRSAENTKKYTDLPFPITIAVLPKLPQTKQCAQTVRKAGKELILHQPMQAMNLDLNPGEGAIKEEMTRAEITATIRENIAELGPDVKGLNNHEGSLITANEVKIGIVLDTCMDLGIYFLDSRTTAETKAPQAALERDFEIFEKAGPYIDNDIDYDKMLVRLRETLDYANKHGKAIVIGHVDKSVKILPKLLSDAYPEMKAAGYKFATPSMLRQKRLQKD